MNGYLATFKKWQLDGRATRTEYWTFSLLNLAVYVVLWVLMMICASPSEDGSISTASLLFLVLMLLFCLATFIPAFCVTVRRLHDTDKSGWWMLVNFVPFVGGLAFFILTLLGSTPGANQYGPHPNDIDAL